LKTLRQYVCRSGAISIGSFAGTGSSTFSIYASTERISVSETNGVEPTNPSITIPVSGFLCTGSPRERIVENSTELIRSNFAGVDDFHVHSICFLKVA
jgi:hypothetical protein